MLTIPFYNYKLKNWERKKEQLLDIISNLSFSNNDKISNVHTTYGTVNETSSKVFSILDDDIKNFLADVNYSGDIGADVWFQKYYENQFHSPHNHGSLGYSSVLYIKFDKDVHKATRFMAPFDSPEGNDIEFSPDVDEGSFIFFPSYLKHYALPNKSNKLRIIMSMNIVQR